MASTTKKKATTRKARAKRGAKAAGGGNPKMQWLIDYMKKHPNAVYAEAAEAAKKAGHQLHPIVWGRAGVMLGRVKQAPRGEGKAAKAKVAKAGAAAGTTARSATTAMPKRGPGRPRKNAAPPAPTVGRASRGSVSIPVASGDLEAMQGLVDAVNAGSTASLRYDGAGWQLVAG